MDECLMHEVLAGSGPLFSLSQTRALILQFRDMH
jgi:hypothetical protein